MSSKVYLLRHGETEWSKNGRHTGKTDIPLTEAGLARVAQSAQSLVGPGLLIDPANLAGILVSPRTRAQQTLAQLNLPKEIPRETTEDIAEWNYGVFEGLTSKQIDDALRHSTKAFSASDARPWNVFEDGCPEGDFAHIVTERLDRLIAKVRQLHKDAPAGERRDCLIVAHGHILRAFAARWIGASVVLARHLTYDAGGVSRLGYEHNRLEEPTIDVWNITPEHHK